MLRKTAAALLPALLLMAAAASPAVAQEDAAGADGAVEILQAAPVVVDVLVPVEGGRITATLPMSAEVSVRIRLVEDAAPTAEPFPAVSLDDAALLLPVLSEMPVGFVQSGEVRPASSNRDIAARYGDPAAFQKFLDEEVKRLGGAYVEFTNSQYSPFTGGNGYIGASILVMADVAGADLYLSGAMERELERSDTAEAVYRISAPPLGDNSILYKVDITENNTQLSAYTLWVRAGNAIISLDARSTRNMGNIDQLLGIARKILSRGLDQPAQAEPVALAREEQAEAADAPADEPEDTAAEDTNEEEEDQTESESSVWDLPHFSAGAAEVMDIGGFQVQVGGAALFDFAMAKELDAANAQFYDNSAFQGATVLGVLDLTLTNRADQDLRLPWTDAVLVVGSEQVQMSDFQYVGDNPFGQALLPGVERSSTFIFALTETDFAELGERVEVRVQMRGPITEKYDEVVDDARYRTSLTLMPSP